MPARWTLSPALSILLDQVNRRWPNRRKQSDGTIGNAEHSARTSDHNPDEDGCVCALDITHDPLNGLDSEKLAEGLRLSHDPRIKYIISNRKIANALSVVKNGRRYEAWEWSPYLVPPNKNPHDHHCHISVTQEGKWKDTMWDLSKVGAPAGDPAQYTPPPRLLRLGHKGAEVMRLQSLLKIESDGHFGLKTRVAVQLFQKAHGLMDDGIVGPATWAKLGVVK